MILWLVLAYARVQLWKGREMQKLAIAQAVKTRTTPAPRGIIFDRNGNKLVDNRRALHLVIQYEDLPRDPNQIEGLAQAFQMEPDQLKRRITATRQAAGNRMLVLQDNLDDSAVARAEVLRARYPFLSIEVAPRRVYLGEDLAGHALGYVGEVTPEELQRGALPLPAGGDHRPYRLRGVAQRRAQGSGRPAADPGGLPGAGSGHLRHAGGHSRAQRLPDHGRRAADGAQGRLRDDPGRGRGAGPAGWRRPGHVLQPFLRPQRVPQPAHPGPGEGVPGTTRTAPCSTGSPRAATRPGPPSSC